MESRRLFSEKASKILLWVIYVLIGGSLISTVVEAAGNVDPTDGNAVPLGMTLVYLIMFVCGIAMFICAPVWIYKAHRDLNRLLPGYPVTPGSSMRMTLIPFYNVWGLWYMAKVMFTTFKEHDYDLKWMGMSLQMLYLFTFVVGGCDNVITRVMQSEMFPSYTEAVKSIWRALSGSTTVLLFVVWYGVVTLVNRGLYWLTTESAASSATEVASA